MSYIDTGRLLQRYRNAVKTSFECIGEKKARKNISAIHDYARELNGRGEELPTDANCCQTGEFNGDGSR